LGISTLLPKLHESYLVIDQNDIYHPNDVKGWTSILQQNSDIKPWHQLMT
jgi:hypothetical protein